MRAENMKLDLGRVMIILKDRDAAERTSKMVGWTFKNTSVSCADAEVIYGWTIKSRARMTWWALRAIWLPAIQQEQHR